MTKRGMVTIGFLVAAALAVILFFALRSSPPEEQTVAYTIAIDAGHGGRDPGATAEDVQEKDINLDVAQSVASLAEGVPELDVVMTRTLDILVPLEDRIAKAEEAGAILYVSIHTNSFTSPDADGVETIVDDTRPMDDDSWVLAELIQDSIVTATGARDRGTRTQASYLDKTELPAVSVEIGYLTNPAEREKLIDPMYQQQVAAAILDGIRAFIDLRYPAEDPSIPN